MRTTLALIGVVLGGVAARADVEVEYIGHAAFVLTSPSGVRVAIDPFNSNRWLGYRFPELMEADAVLITHPHYDHDASYYFDEATPVFREPGRYRVGDVELLGVEGRHADPYGRDFGQINTIWRVVTGGVSLVHIGDNGPLSEANVRELGPVDVLFVPADGDDHILKGDAIEAIREGLSDPLVVPMHYRLSGFLDLPESLGPVDPWLQKQDGVVRLGTNRATLSAGDDSTRRVAVFDPSPALKPWSDELARAWRELAEARQILANHPNQASQALALVERAFAAGEGVVFAFHWAQALSMMDRVGEAKGVLEAALAAAGRDDWEYRMRAHALLAEIYASEGKTRAAEAHYRSVLAGSHRSELTERAKSFLSR